MTKKPRRSKAAFAPEARRDIREVLKWSKREFGERAAFRYSALLKQAVRDIEEDPSRPGSQIRPELAEGTRVYHLRFSRDRAKSSIGAVQTPRHFLYYRRLTESLIEVSRVLHDSFDLSRHLPEDYGRDEAQPSDAGDDE